MIKDTLFKTLSIPVLGVLIPLLSKLIRYPEHDWMEIIISNMIFIATSYIIWQGCVQIISRIRRLVFLQKKFFLKLATLCLVTAAYAYTISFLSGFLWQQIFSNNSRLQSVFDCALICALTVIFLTLIYEALFLSKERELDIKIVDQLDIEKQYAELNSLKGELDPHFVFNALTTLSHLISIDTDRAQQFIQKLAQVYKYLLINKDRELISLSDEIKFVDDYFFLLSIRYDNRLRLSLNIGNNHSEKIMILPCSLQLLIENAIKHNQFSEAEPLQINICLNGEYLIVENNLRSRQYVSDSTRIGLVNLSNRYRLVYNKDIIIKKEDNNFIVKLPLIKQSSL